VDAALTRPAQRVLTHDLAGEAVPLVVLEQRERACHAVHVRYLGRNLPPAHPKVTAHDERKLDRHGHESNVHHARRRRTQVER
jgi:hypothetical protein